MSQTRTIFEMGLKEYARTPVFLALLVFLPAYVIALFARVVPDQPVPVDVPGEPMRQLAMTDVTAILMTPVVAALVGGFAGLFLMQSAREADSRLSIVGARVRNVILARAGVLALASLFASLVAVGVASLTYTPERVAWFVLAVSIVGLLYGGLGALVGLVFNRLAGVYVIMFAPLIDLFLAQSPLAEGSPAIAPYLPGFYPTRLAFDAAFTSTVDLANLAGSAGYLLLVGVVTAVAFARTIRTG